MVLPFVFFMRKAGSELFRFMGIILNRNKIALTAALKDFLIVYLMNFIEKIRFTDLTEKKKKKV